MSCKHMEIKETYSEERLGFHFQLGWATAGKLQEFLCRFMDGRVFFNTGWWN